VGSRWRGSHLMPGSCLGRAPGKTRFNVPQCKANCAIDFFISGFRNKKSPWNRLTVSLRDYRTDLMISPSKVPVTVAIFPACWSRVAKAALSAFQAYKSGRPNQGVSGSVGHAARVHAAAVSPSMCFLPHIASPTSPVKYASRPQRVKIHHCAR